MSVNLQMLIGKKRVNLSVEYLLAKQFLYNNFQISLIESTYEIAIANNCVVLVCEKNYSENNTDNNIVFYDFDGKNYANIKDIIGEINDDYTGVYLHSYETLTFCEQKLDKDHIYCVCNTWNDHHYVIDLNEMKLVEEFHNR